MLFSLHTGQRKFCFGPNLTIFKGTIKIKINLLWEMTFCTTTILYFILTELTECPFWTNCSNSSTAIYPKHITQNNIIPLHYKCICHHKSIQLNEKSIQLRAHHSHVIGTSRKLLFYQSFFLINCSEPVHCTFYGAPDGHPTCMSLLQEHNTIRNH